MEDSETVTGEYVQDSTHVDPQEIKCTTAAPEPVDETKGDGPGQENQEEKEETNPEANDGEESEVAKNVNTVSEEEEVPEETDEERNNETGVNEEGNEGNNQSPTKENHITKADDKCEEEGKLEEKNKGDKLGNNSESQTEKTEDKDIKEIQEKKDHVQDKEKNPAKKSGTASSSALRAQMKSSVCPRGARPSTRRDAMAKFQMEQTPGVRNFKVQRTSVGLTGGASIKQKILQWCKNKTHTYEGVNIENFSSSWSDGLAFCALVHRFFPDAFDFSSLKASEREKNFTLAFSKAESLADCCPLLDVSDMLIMGKNPDPMCVFTYVQALCHHLSKIDKERKEKEKTEDKNKEEHQEVAEVEQEDKTTTDENEQNQTNMKTDEEVDQNENVINTDAVINA